MKKFFYTILTATAMLLASCDAIFYDDSALTDRVNELEERVASLEELCAQMNTNISAMQTIISALQNNDYVTSVVPVIKDDKEVGYTITFTKSKPITIYHGDKGEKGELGDKGDTGATGHNPLVGVRQDTDGIYYWTLDGEWLTDSAGNKIKAVGSDGSQGEQGEQGEKGEKGDTGENGADAIAPKLKIENDRWMLSTDGGTTWTDIGQAKGDKGEDGQNGVDGDSFFQNVKETDAAVIFILTDKTTITIPKTQPLALVFAQTDGISIQAGETVAIDFTVNGGTSDTRLGVIAADGWRTTIAKNADNVSGQLTVTAPDPFIASVISVWVSNNERTLFYSLSFEQGVLNVTSASSFNLTAEAQTFNISVSTNLDYTIEIPAQADWITKVETRALRTETTAFRVTANEAANRSTQLAVKTASTTLATIDIVQYGLVATVDFAEGVATVGMPAAGVLKSSLTENSIAAADITKLVVSGSLNGTDIKFIRSLASLTMLDISDASIVAGGDAYYQSYTTADNVVGDYMFYARTKLTEVRLPSSATSVGSYVFGNCIRLQKVVIGNSCKSVGQYAFNQCVKLTEVNIPDSVTSIGDSAFSGCSSLTSITIPEGVTSIDWNAFSGCSSLASITIPDSVTSIGGWALSDCTKLTAVHITDIASWCKISFNGSNPLSVAHNLYLNGELVTDLVIPDSVTSIGDSAFSDCTSLASITIPEGVTSIGSNAFYGCSSLASITIPDSVTSIGSGVFYECTSLTSVTIGNGVISIGYHAFNGCSSLASIIIPDSVTSIDDSTFSGCSSLTSINIPDSVTSIGDSAFSGCTSLASITIPECVTSIGRNAFNGCTSLTSITIPDSVTSIGGSAFSGCSSLTSINIPDSVTSIGGSAFGGCSSLASITIPEGVTSIGTYAFYDCTSLASVYCKPTAPPTLDVNGRSWFDNNAAGRKIHVPMASVDAYKSAAGWREYAANIVGYDF